MTSKPDTHHATTPPEDAFDFLDYGLSHQFGELHMLMDKPTGLKAITAIHSTKLGPALGGCRFIHYPSTHAAILDAMRLARGMSYKAALAQLPLGGGKTVILQPAGPYDRNGYFDAFGRFLERLNGQYITAADSGVSELDMDRIHLHTKYVTGLSSEHGDPAPYTARGVLRGIEAMVEQVLGKTSLHKVHVAIQGLGHVGFKLAEYLHANGAVLTVSDIDPDKTHEAHVAFGATVVSTDIIHAVPCDVFSPCALGAIINDDTIESLQTPIIAGAANNQLAHSYHGQRLLEKGIAYAVDYVINSGGLMFAASQYLKTEETLVHAQIDEIANTLTTILKQSLQQDKPSNVIADLMAEKKLQ
ncbi:MAG: amino acid dehydrogenase [Gammaproteobacteria bacterium]|nr:amino acid dehydrogenase [Gammaproteobacteria bacterium]